MALAPTLPQIEHPISPVSSAAPVSSATAADKPGKKRRWITIGALLLFVVAIVANVAIIVAIAHRGDPGLAATVHPQVQTPPAPAAPPAALPGLATTFGEGRFVVGTDIAAGTYRSTGPSVRLDCYWERLKDNSVGPDSIIANNLGRGPATVTIDQRDGAFQTRWCSTWTRVN